MPLNLGDILKNTEQLKAQMEEAERSVEAIRVTGTSGGDLVQVELNGKFEVTNIKIDPLAVDPRDVKMLEELIQSAHYAALIKAQAKVKEELAGKMGGMGLPPGIIPGI